jgi:hypothetical protein
MLTCKENTAPLIYEAIWYLLLLCMLCLLLLLSLPSNAQVGFEIDNKKHKKVRLPFEMHRNLILIKAKINGYGPFSFLLDTGVSNSIITDPSLKDSLQLSQGRNIVLVGAGDGDNLQAFVTYGLTIQMSGITATKHSMAVLSSDILQLSSYVGVPVHGILGYDFFCNMVVDINFHNNTITLHRPLNYKYKGKGVAVPITLEERRPYLKAFSQIDDSIAVPVKLIIDTGAGHALSLETGTHEKITISDPAIRTQLGIGLNGIINGYMGRTKNFTIGRYHIKNVITSFPDFELVAAKNKIPRNGNLGIDMLRRFNIIFDYSRQMMYLTPNKFYKERFEHDMCGIELVAGGENYRQYIIYKIYPDTPAEQAGLLPGDELIAIDSDILKDMEVTAVSKLLRSRHGRRLNILLKRDGELIFTQVMLKRQI